MEKDKFNEHKLKYHKNITLERATKMFKYLLYNYVTEIKTPDRTIYIKEDDGIKVINKRAFI